MKNSITRSLKLEIKKEPDDDGRFEGYASVFEVVDQGLDVMAKGAFTQSLIDRMPKLLWQHDSEQIIGVWEEIKEDERGLFVKGRIFKDLQQGREAMTLLREGVLDSMSIGFRIVEAMEEAGGRVRRLLKLDLFEISLVTFPMLLEAVVTGVKSCETERDFEKFLRDAGGLSRKEAKAVCAKGFKAITDLRDAENDETDDSEAMAELVKNLNQLTENVSNGN